MSTGEASFIARARSDEQDRMLEADEPLASLQEACGGEIGSTIAIPELLALTRKARSIGLRLSREIKATDGQEAITAWVEVAPIQVSEEEGCEIAVISWHAAPLPDEDEGMNSQRKIEIDRHLAELTARLGPRQNLLSVDSDAADLKDLRSRMEQGIGRPWTDFVEFPALNAHEQPLHWRLLDGARCRIEGSDRHWTATLVPLGQPDPGRAGFELYFSAETPLNGHTPVESSVDRGDEQAASLGHDIAPVLRQPIGRIIDNAETIRTRLAGPLADEYSNYASDIGDAARHLLGLIDDLADLEAVEDEDFTTAPDEIDLVDAIHRASGMLAGSARDKRIALDIPGDGASQPAIGEFRRVMQVLINLVGNAIRYAPEASAITLTTGQKGTYALLTVADEGPGLSPEQQALVFDKFERLGRSGDGGSGLGLYISRRLARAMGGDLIVESAPGQGARFTLSLPMQR